jgi:diguanylate cyclase (GGDEF)-like protein/PAS domain S-box-containing protein
MSDHSSQALSFATKPGHEPASDAEQIRVEYARAIDLINSVRDVGNDVSHGKARLWSAAASKVSADFFCAAEHPGRGWYGFLADSAGHGLASAIFALHTPALFRESVLLGLSLSAIHERIDRFLHRQRIPGNFVCGLLVRIQGREIEVVNAGMPDGLLLDGHGQCIHRFASNELPFGIERTGGVEPERYRLDLGSRAELLLCSDGLSEMPLPSGKAGTDGLLDFAARGTGDLFDRLVGLVESSRAAVHDDLSIVVMPVPMAQGEKKLAAGVQVLPSDGAGPSQNVEAALRIVESFDRGLVLTDAGHRIVYVNPAFTAITGYTLAEAIGQTPRLLQSGRHGKSFYRDMWLSLRDRGTWSGEIWNRRKDGTLYLEWLDINALHDEEGRTTHYLATFTVLDHYEKIAKRVSHLALHDPLTGLANRILLADRGEHALLRADRTERAMAVLFIDLDRFQTINDSLGHEVGDQVLIAAAERMSSVLRDEDTLCRYGGDEFVCLLPDIAQREDASLVAGKLLAVLEQPVQVDGHRFKIGASVGISAYPSDGQAFDDLMVFAERAMQRAKQAGGNLYRFFNAQMAVAAQQQLEIEARLDAAIRNGELELHLQPKVDMRERRIVGAEALVRWRDPQRGLIPPGEFIPVAEKSDLIAKIGYWVLKESCAILARRNAELPEDFHIAVNVSPMQLDRSDFSAEVSSALLEHGVSSARLQLEVTESVFIRDAALAAQTLDQITAQGISIALDDFGTGYSNMSLLSHLPLDTFKLDQTFVRGVHAKPAHKSIAKAVWHLADGLAKDVVAEGVESCDECIVMQSLGYRLGQGYRFGKPLPEEEFLSYLTDWQACSSCPYAGQ